MKNFHDFYFGMTPQQREKYAAKLKSSVGYMERVAGGFALPSLRFAVRMVRCSGGDINIDSIVKTYEARSGKL